MISTKIFITILLQKKEYENCNLVNFNERWLQIAVKLANFQLLGLNHSKFQTPNVWG